MRSVSPKRLDPSHLPMLSLHRGRRDQPLALEPRGAVDPDLLHVRIGGDCQERLARRVLDETDHVKALAAAADHLRIDASDPQEATAPRLDECPHRPGIAPVRLFSRNPLVRCVRLRREAQAVDHHDRPSGDLAGRARALVGRRVAFFERIAPYKRAANLKRWRSPFLRARHAELVRVLRADLVRRLPELRQAPEAFVDALDLATSFEAWDRLRTEQRLGRERAHAAVERMVLALVAELAR